MFIHRRQPWTPKDGNETPPDVALDRRRWLKRAGWGALGVAAAGSVWGGWRTYRGSDAEVLAAGRPRQAERDRLYPARRNDRFHYDRNETLEAEAARFANYFEFTTTKRVWPHVEEFSIEPWMVEVGGLCRKPFRLDFSELLTRFAPQLEERLYRHRCVETWAMAVPWTGFPLAELVRQADPLPTATHVRFTGFLRPAQAKHQRQSPDFPWPYVEGLTLPEATNELTLLATGMYGHPLLKQHGAPLRLVVPWMYGYKSAKGIQRIDFVADEPETFWTTLAPDAYPFRAVVDPDVPVPWSQSSETMLGTGEVFPTQKYNGYGEFVAGLYR